MHKEIIKQINKAFVGCKTKHDAILLFTCIMFEMIVQMTQLVCNPYVEDGEFKGYDD